MGITADGLIHLGFTPEIDFSLRNDGAGIYIEKWLSSDAQPSVADIEAAEITAHAEYDAQAYARSRKIEYPDIGDQLDDLFHKGVFSTEMAATLQALKDKYPKE